MNEEERDIVEFVDEEGNALLLEVVDSFFYNGEEFAVLTDVAEDGCECGSECSGCGEHEHDHDHGEEQALYIMKVEVTTDEDGEEVEEFTPVEDSLMDALIEIVQTRFFDEDDDDLEEEEGE